MIQLVFINGSRLRRIHIRKREVAMFSSEVPDKPIIFNLDKLDDEETKESLKNSNIDQETLEELSQLKTEEDLAKDIIKDFRSTGWRLFKRINNDSY